MFYRDSARWWRVKGEPMRAMQCYRASLLKSLAANDGSETDTYIDMCRFLGILQKNDDALVIALHAQDNTTIASQAQQAALDELYGLGHGYDKTFDQRMTAVTRDDVIGVARKYLSGPHVLVTSSPEDRE